MTIGRESPYVFQSLQINNTKTSYLYYVYLPKVETETTLNRIYFSFFLCHTLSCPFQLLFSITLIKFKSKFVYENH